MPEINELICLLATQHLDKSKSFRLLLASIIPDFGEARKQEVTLSILTGHLALLIFIRNVLNKQCASNLCHCPTHAKCGMYHLKLLLTKTRVIQRI